MCVCAEDVTFPIRKLLPFACSPRVSGVRLPLIFSTPGQFSNISIEMNVYLLIIFAQIHSALGYSESCIHGGAKYKHGDYFRPNNTIVRIGNPQQCVQCRCHEGLVICEIENCPLPSCENPVREPRLCCHRCPEETHPSNRSSGFVRSQFHSGKGGCRSSGRYYAEGSVWQPLIGPLGVMSCVRCQCDRGAIICKRYKCKELPCSHPQKEFGKCCRVCPDPEKDTKGSQSECLPKSSELFVFRTPDAGESSTVIEYAFYEGRSRKDSVHSHVWNTHRKGDNLLALKTITYEEFLSHKLRLLGATSFRRFQKYSKREERLRLKCFTDCPRKILRLERTLKIYLVDLRNRCNDDELDSSELWQFSFRK